MDPPTQYTLREALYLESPSDIGGRNNYNIGALVIRVSPGPEQEKEVPKTKAPEPKGPQQTDEVPKTKAPRPEDEKDVPMTKEQPGEVQTATRPKQPSKVPKTPRPEQPKEVPKTGPDRNKEGVQNKGQA